MIKLLVILFISLSLTGCAGNQVLVGSSLKPMPVVDYVDLDRFMGDWFVIATIPTFLERDAYNPIETYQRDNNGSIATTFTFNKGSLNGPTKIYRPRGFVKDKRTNAIWGMQFVWPIKADYRIVYLDDNYQQTIIGRNSRDYVWVMARTPTISKQDYSNLVTIVGSLGYDLDALKKANHE
jgi:apolipoprotein D and lipocalin family protein